MAGNQELWERLSRGDAAAFEEFYRQESPRVRNFLRLYVGTPQAADDIAQEAFMQLWRSPNGFDPTRGTLKAYVFGIARKRAADWWRRQRPAGDLSAEPAQARGETTALLEDALARLAPDERGLLWLREVEGYSYDELAEILGIPLGTVKSRLFAARERLRALWLSRPRES
ncbi:MAG: RNA polymerase sigma factor [Terriglobia bacterium]